MKKLICFGLCLAALSATSAFADPGAPPSYEEAEAQSSSVHLTKDSKNFYKELFTNALEKPDGLGTLFATYKNSDLSVKKDADQCLLQPVLKSLCSNDAPQTLVKLGPFFQEFLPRTQWGSNTIRKALKNVLERQLDLVQTPYHRIKHPSKQALEKGENMLSPADLCERIYGEYALKAIKKDRRKNLQNSAKILLPLLKSRCNHAYIKDQIFQEKIDQLAAIYKHLPWLDRRTFNKILRKSRNDEKRALKNQLKGLIRMTK